MSLINVTVKELDINKRNIHYDGITFTQATYKNNVVVLPSELVSFPQLHPDFEIPLFIPDIPIVKRNIHLAVVWVSVMGETIYGAPDTLEKYHLWNSFKRFCYDVMRCKGFDDQTLKYGKLVLTTHLGKENRKLITDCFDHNGSHKQIHYIRKIMYSPDSRWCKKK